MNAPAISVLMPAYNAQRYLAQAMRSVLAQSLGDFELIVIDDGSTDRSPAILERFAQRDGRIRIFRQPNGGIIRALNAGLVEARGELIARMDADDVCLPDRFAIQAEYLHQHPAVVCVGGNAQMIDEAGRLLTLTRLDQDDQRMQAKALAGYSPILHPTAMIRRRALLSVGGYDPAMVAAEDYDLWLKLGEAGQLANVSNIVLKYRLHPHSISSMARARQLASARLACQRAWQRRGIAGTFEPGRPERDGGDILGRHCRSLRYGGWAMEMGERRTAATYAVQAIATMPFRRAGWQLLLKATTRRRA